MSAPEGGKLGANVMHFARLLRRAGLPVGPSEAIAAQRALAHVDLGQRAEVRDALRAVMVHRHDQREVFDQAFALFWRNPVQAEQQALMGLLSPEKAPKPEKPPPGSRRVAEAMAAAREQKPKMEETP